MATRRRCFSWLKNRSTRLRTWYTCRSYSRCTSRFFFGGITASAPRAATRDRLHEGVAVVALVTDHRPGLDAGDQLRRAGDVARLAGREQHPHRVARAIDGDVNLRGKPAPRAAQFLLRSGAAFGPGGVLVGPHDGRVEPEPLQVGVLKFIEDSLPGPLAGPAEEAFMDRVEVAKADGQVSPGGTGAGDPEDRIEEEAVVGGNEAGVAWLARQQGGETARRKVRIDASCQAQPGEDFQADE